MRGMVTHDLIQRGLGFDEAYAVARAVRDRVRDRGEVTTTELEDVIHELLEQTMGSEEVARLRSAEPPGPELTVLYHGQAQPFSRGLLARSLYGAGLDLDRAYHLVTGLQGALRGEGVEVLASEELARRVGDLLERHEGREVATRYRLMRRIRRLPRPLVLFIGGASGTGKSTLALELAPLLRIYRITATDTIRQVMRMVFSPAILPALHRSSFEPPTALYAAPDWQEAPSQGDHLRLLTEGFAEQATRVLVGVRAVVDRSIAERTSMLVEGVHLLPGSIPFPDLEGAVYQVPVLLTTFNEEVHRSRVLSRGQAAGRRPERHLRSFGAIRAIHQHLIQLAESHDIPILDTSDFEAAVQRSLRLVTDLLQRRLPTLAHPVVAGIERPAPTLLLVLDGVGDRPVRALGGRTPLQAAHTPTLDRLARDGRCGVADPVAPGVVPDTAGGTLALFGQSPLAMRRGPVEALGTDLDLAPGDIALRANLATLDDRGRIVDRRAGRIREGAQELAAALDRLPLPGEPAGETEVRVRVATEHRLAVVLRGSGLSSAIEGSDPGDGAPPGPPLTPRPRDPGSPRAVRTAHVLALFEEGARQVLAEHPVNDERRARGLLAANCVLTRGAGRLHRLMPLEEAGLPLSVSCISGDHTVLGLANWLGARPVHGPGMTANLDTDVSAKFAAAADELLQRDLVVLHLKGADIAAHDRRPDLKVDFLERVDRELGALLAAFTGPLRLAVASDHATFSEAGHHGADPVPVLIWGAGIEPDEVARFDEVAAGSGALRRFPLQMLLGRLFDLS
jgi:2,3-bisphosphoglycerate-independent phosphoglycerate mutase